MAIQAARLLVDVKASTATAEAALKRMDGRLDSLKDHAAPAASAARLFGKAAVAGFGVMATQAVVGGVTQFTAALAPMAGLTAALPGIMGGAAAAMATVKVGTLGMGEAMKHVGDDAKKFTEAIKDLSPEAQALAKAVRALKPEFDGFRKVIQDALFDDLAAQVTRAGNALMDGLQRPMRAVATSLNGLASQVLDFAGSAPSIRNFAGLFDNTARAITNAGDALGPMMEGLRSVMAVGADYLPRMGTAIGNLGTRFGDFLNRAADSGQVNDWIDHGITAARQFGSILGNLGSAFGGVMDAARGAGGGVLATLDSLSQRLATFVNSAAGQDSLRAFFASAQQSAAALWPVIEQVVHVMGALSPVLAAIATGVGPGLTAFLAALVPALQALQPSAAQLGVAMGQFLTSLVPLIPPLTSLVQMLVSGLVPILSHAGPAVVGLAGAFYGLKAATGAVSGIKGALDGVSKAVDVAKTAAHGIGDFASGFRDASAAASSFTGRMGTLGGAASKGLSWVGQGISTMASLAGAWIKTAAVATANAVRMAAAWVMAMGPVGWIITAVVALVALIILNWDKVKAATLAAWSAIGGALGKAWDVIKSVGSAIGGFFASLPGKIMGALAALPGLAMQAISALGNALVNGLKAWLTAMLLVWVVLPMRIMEVLWGLVQQVPGALKSLWDTISGAFVAGVEAVVGFMVALPGRIMDAIKSLVGTLVSWTVGLWKAVAHAYWTGIQAVVAFMVALPGRIMGAIQFLIARMTAWAVGAWNATKAAFTAGISAVVSFASSLPGRVMGAIQSLGSKITSLASRAWSSFRNAVVQGATAAVNWVRGLPGKIIGALGNVGRMLFDSGRAILRGLVDGIKSMAGAVKDAVGDALANARNLLPFSPAKEGPFSGKGWTLYSGRSISDGLAEGIADRAKAVRQAALGLAEAAQVAIPGPRMGPGAFGAPGGAQGPRRAPASKAAIGVADASGPSAVTFQFTTYNPVAEAESVTTNRALQRAAALGLV